MNIAITELHVHYIRVHSTHYKTIRIAYRYSAIILESTTIHNPQVHVHDVYMDWYLLLELVDDQFCLENQSWEQHQHQESIIVTCR